MSFFSKTALVKVLGLATVFLLAILAFGEFSRQCFSYIHTYNKMRLAEVCAQNIDAIRMEFQKSQDYVKSAALGFAHVPDLESAHAAEFLRELESAAGFSRVWVVDAGGVAHNSQGDSIDVSSREYVRQARAGRSGIVRLHRSALTDKPVFCVYSPIPENHGVEGILLGIYELDTMIVKANNPQFGGTAYVHVFDENGDMVIRSDHANSVIDSDNLFDFLGRAEVTGEQGLDAVRRAIADRGEGLLEYRYGGKERTAFFAPLGTNGWMIFGATPTRYFHALSAGLESLAAKLVLELLGCFLLLLAGIVYFSNKSRKALLDVNNRLQLSNQRFRFAALNLSEGLVGLDIPTGSLSSISGEARPIDDPAVDLLPGRRIVGDSMPLLEAALAELRRGAKTASATVECRAEDGSRKWYRLHFANMFLDDNRPVEAIGTIEDVTGWKETENAFARVEQHRRAMLSDAVDTFVFNISKGRYIYDFHASENTSRKHDTVYLGKLQSFIKNTVHPDFHDTLLESLSENFLKGRFAAGATKVETEFRARDGAEGEKWRRIVTNLALDPERGDLMGYATVEDITAEKRREQALKRDAERDGLTGLYNRAAADALIRELLNGRSVSETGRMDAFFIVDLDRFKYVNDTYGHAAGDEVLRKLGTALAGLFRERDVVGRMGGDEFVVFMTGARSADVIRYRAAGICRALAKITFRADPAHRVSGSVGVCLVDGETPSLETLYDRADLALYSSKHRGRDCFAIYEESMAATDAARSDAFAASSIFSPGGFNPA